MTLSIVAIAALFFQNWLHMKERKSLLDRIMARDYEQFEYYQKMFKGEVKELKDQRDEVKKEISEDDEIKKEMDLTFEKEKKYLEEMKEDWDESEVDLSELRKRINKD